MNRPPTADLLAQIGRALYGEHWVTGLARDLSLNERTVRRIAAAVRDGETYFVADGIWTDARALLQTRAAELQALASRL